MLWLDTCFGVQVGAHTGSSDPGRDLGISDRPLVVGPSHLAGIEERLDRVQERDVPFLALFFLSTQRVIGSGLGGGRGEGRRILERSLHWPTVT